MTKEDLNKAIAEMKSEGYDDDEILASFYAMFQKDEIDFNTLEALTHAVGYELTEDFKAMNPEDQKTKGYEENEAEVEEENEEEEAMKLFGMKD